MSKSLPPASYVDAGGASLFSGRTLGSPGAFNRLATIGGLPPGLVEVGLFPLGPLAGSAILFLGRGDVQRRHFFLPIGVTTV